MASLRWAPKTAGGPVGMYPLTDSPIVTTSHSKGTTTLVFCKQKTAYEIKYGVVGSEMCIRDRFVVAVEGDKAEAAATSCVRVQMLSLIHM